MRRRVGGCSKVKARRNGTPLQQSTVGARMMATVAIIISNEIQ